MIRSFARDAVQDVFDGFNSKIARKVLVPKLFSIARRKLDMIDSAIYLDDIKIPPANRLEALKGTLKGFHSIRINDQYRIIFRWVDCGAEDVDIVDYH